MTPNEPTMLNAEDPLLQLQTSPFTESFPLTSDQKLAISEQKVLEKKKEAPATESSIPSPQDPFALGEKHAVAGKPLEAMVCYQQALDANNEQGAIALEKLFAQCLTKESLLKLIKEGIRQEISECYYHLAKFYEQQQDYPNALMAIRRYNRLTHKKYPKGLELQSVIFSHL